jgi:hypothetical protein
MTYGICVDKGLRVGQRVCRVEWKNGIPCIRVGRITRVTAKGGKPREVDGVADIRGFTHSADAAIRIAYRDIFDDASRYGVLGIGYSRNENPIKIDDAMKSLTRLRRLERRLFAESEAR